MNSPVKKAFWLCAQTGIIQPVLIQSLADMQEFIGGYIELAPIPSKIFSVYVDEEGLIKNLNYGFKFAYSDLFRGNGLVFGRPTRGGEETSCALPIATIYDLTSFYTKQTA